MRRDFWEWLIGSTHVTHPHTHTYTHTTYTHIDILNIKPSTLKKKKKTLDYFNVKDYNSSHSNFKKKSNRKLRLLPLSRRTHAANLRTLRFMWMPSAYAKDERPDDGSHTIRKIRIDKLKERTKDSVLTAWIYVIDIIIFIIKKILRKG